jgi:hypothetical protein
MQIALSFLYHRIKTVLYRAFKETPYEEAVRIMNYIHAFELRENFKEVQDDPYYLGLLKRLRVLSQANPGKVCREVSIFLQKTKTFRHAQI